MTSGRLFAPVLIVSVMIAVAGAWAQTTQPAATDHNDLTVSRPRESSDDSAADQGAKGADQATTAPAKTTGGGQSQSNPFDWKFLGIMLLMFILVIFWSNWSKKKQTKKRTEMLASLKKGSKITSIGGIIGTVIETRDDEVVVKVDDTNNVRLRFARWAIRGVGEQAKTDNPEDSK
jgi:preprotein translocase subunit YajC